MYDSRLPLVTFYLTERCNSRCVTCDYWRHGRKDATLESVLRVLPELRALGTRVVLLSGGEPLLHPEWQPMAAALRGAGLEVWLLTAGLALNKFAAAAAAACDSITVSLDGTNAATYRAIRGLDAFDKVCEGIRAVVSRGARVSLRVTLQRANYRELPQFVALAHRLGVQQVSFLGVDVGNSHAFARGDDAVPDLALAEADLVPFAEGIDTLEREHAADFRTGFIAESPAKLRRLHRYFRALLGAGEFPAVKCNAPEFSAVIGVEGQVSPCFFIAGTGAGTASGLATALSDERMRMQRAMIATGRHPACKRCVCSMWREPATFAASEFPRERRHG